MDVSLRLSLKGGHHWEFVCDEDDPMVFGLISALPGATLDNSLPPDGLIQVESRNGQRLFLSRSSLVAVTVNRLAARRPTGDGVHLLAATPFVTRTDVFEPSTIDRLLRKPAGQSSAEVDDPKGIDADRLPAPAVDTLVRLLSDAKAYLMPEHHGDTHLDLGVHQPSGDGPFRLPMERKSKRLLDFVISLMPAGAASPDLVVALPDRWIGREEDGVPPTARSLPLGPNTALVFPANGLSTLDLQFPMQQAAPVVVSGSLCQGSAIGSR